MRSSPSLPSLRSWPSPRPKPVADLLDRVLGNLTPEESNLVLPPDSLIAALRERQRGRLTRNQIKNALGLTNADDTSLNTVYTNITQLVPLYSFDEVRDLLMLGCTRNRNDPAGAAYYSKATILSRLGL